MEIVQKSVKDITPYERNNRKHPEQQIARIAESIKSYGFNQPIVIDECNTVLVGHGRLLAAQKLGLDKIPTYQVKGLSETKKKAYRILDNKLQNDSTWEFENLESELRLLEDDGFDLAEWGLDELTSKNFDAASVEEQGALDELTPKLVKCPACEHVFDARDRDVKA